MDEASRSTGARIAYHIVAAFIAATSVAAAAPASAAVDMFLKLDGIKGESKDSKHKEELDVLSWSWGAAKGGSNGQRANPSSACGRQLVVTKFVDKATPGLVTNLVEGVPMRTGTLTVRKAGDRPLEYLVIKLENVQVTSTSTGGSGGEDVLTENVTFAFAGGKLIYTPQKDDGSADASVESVLPPTCP